MKSLLVISLLLFTLPTFSQQGNTSNVVLSIIDCRGDDRYAWQSCDSISFFKLPENTLAFKILPRESRELPINLGAIPVAKYKLVYANNYKQHATKQIDVSGLQKILINICLDSLTDYPQNTLIKLQENDTISIEFKSDGCFHSEKNRIVIIKKSDQFVATISFLESLSLLKKNKKADFKNRLASKSVVLTEENVQAFVRFENELNYAKDNGCTTVDEYDIKGKYLTIHKVDGSCKWNGFHHLKKSFFGDRD